MIKGESSCLHCLYRQASSALTALFLSVSSYLSCFIPFLHFSDFLFHQSIHPERPEISDSSLTFDSHSCHSVLLGSCISCQLCRHRRTVKVDFYSESKINISTFHILLFVLFYLIWNVQIIFLYSIFILKQSNEKYQNSNNGILLSAMKTQHILMHQMHIIDNR